KNTPKTGGSDCILAALVRENSPKHCHIEWIFECARHNADDFVRHIAECDCLAHDLTASPKLFLPKIITKHDGWFRVTCRIVSLKGTTDQRFLAKNAKVVCSNKTARNCGRFLDAR